MFRTSPHFSQAQGLCLIKQHDSFLPYIQFPELFTVTPAGLYRWSKSLWAPDDYSIVQVMIWRWPSQNTFGMWIVLYWKQFGVSMNVWRLAGNTLNSTCNFLYCKHQVHRDFLITLYNAIWFLWQAKPRQLIEIVSTAYSTEFKKLVK
jgi:hypothetical protein